MSNLKIEQHTSGFLKDAEYSAHVYLVAKKYEDRFGGATSLIVHLDEVHYHQLSNPPQPTVSISADGKEIVIHCYSWRHYNNKGNITGLPSQQEVFDGLRFWLNRAATDYEERFPTLA